MALEESIDGLHQLDSNGVTAYIDPKLKSFLEQFGQINVDFVSSMGRSGFTVQAGQGGDCGSCSGSSSCG